MLAFGDVEIDFTSMEAKRAGEPVSMTAQEFKLLKFLARSPGRVISREELLNEVWGYQNYPSTRTVDNHILRLRQKLEPDPAHPRYFVTVHGAGLQICLRQRGMNKKIKALRGEIRWPAAVAISTAAFHTADYLRADGRDSPDHPANRAHPIADQVKFSTEHPSRNLRTFSGSCNCSFPAPRRCWPKFPL